MDRYGLRIKKKVFYIVVSSSSCRDGLGRGRHEAMSGRCDLGRHLVGSGSMSARPSKVHDVGPWLLLMLLLLLLLLLLFLVLPLLLMLKDKLLVGNLFFLSLLARFERDHK